MNPNAWNTPRKAAFWTASFTLVAIGSWVVFYEPLPPSPIPYLKGSSKVPDSLARRLELEQQLAQLLIYAPAPILRNEQQHAYVPDWSNPQGGFWLKDINFSDYLSICDSLQRSASIPLFFFSDNPVLHNNQFADVGHIPAPGTMAAVPGMAHHDQINELFVRQSEVLGINLVAPLDLEAPWRDTLGQFRLLQNLSQAHVITGAKGFSRFDIQMPDTLPPMAPLLHNLDRLHARGLGLLVFEGRIARSDSLEEAGEGFLSKYLFEKIAYQGLIAGIVSEEAPLEYWMKAGADLFISRELPSRALPRMKKAIEEGRWRRSAVRRSLRKVLMAKEWMSERVKKRYSKNLKYNELKTRMLPEKNEKEDYSTKSPEGERMWKHFRESNWEQLSYRFREQALLVTHNSEKMVPWERLKDVDFFVWSPGNLPYATFIQMAEKYVPVKWLPGVDNAVSAMLHADSGRCAVLALLDPHLANPLKDTSLLQTLRVLNKSRPLVVVNFGIPRLYDLLDSTFATIHLFEQHRQTESLAAQLFFGGVSARGEWPHYEPAAPPGSATRAIRLAFAPPERSGVAPEKLVGIDAIARSAIGQGVIPGCQVLLAKDGRVIYSKAFGHPTFKKETGQVQLQSVYDIASLTKMAATTLAIMRLYEERRISLDDPLSLHIRRLRGKPVGNIALRNLLVHQSGLPVGLPAGKYLRARKYGRLRCGNCFCNKKRGEFTIPVGEKLFFSRLCKDEMIARIAEINPAKKPRYRYSDINFWLLQQVVEAKTEQPFDEYLHETFYRPLGLRHTAFNASHHLPLQSVVPSALDKTLRRGLVQGFVHDPAAALLGGVSGHAGLFSNAEDLAVIMQLLLDKGRYAGKQWFSPETVQLFTRKTFGNHRSLGFDHPSRENRYARARNAPMAVFGHTGFTGTCAWADPENRLIFIFLSNRTYPDGANRAFLKRNIRGRIHQVAYDALGSYSPVLPVLE